MDDARKHPPHQDVKWSPHHLLIFCVDIAAAFPRRNKEGGRINSKRWNRPKSKMGFSLSYSREKTYCIADETLDSSHEKYSNSRAFALERFREKKKGALGTFLPHPPPSPKSNPLTTRAQQLNFPQLNNFTHRLIPKKVVHLVYK